MNKQEAVLFLFEIAKEIKRSFESPVILLTLKDYANCIFNSLVDMRATLLQNAMPERIKEIVNTFHFEWLQAVQDIETFKKRVKDFPREIILKTIDFTMENIKIRHKYFQKYIEQINKTMTVEEKNLIWTDLEIIKDMREIVNFALIEKQKYLRNQADKQDFYAVILSEVEELLNWLDKLYDHLAIQFNKVLNLKVPELPSDLTKTLQQIIDEVVNYPSPDAAKIAEEITAKYQTQGAMARMGSYNNSEISKIVEKIKRLENRIHHLKNEKTSAQLALQHKTIFLEDRLESLENLKLSLYFLRDQTNFRDDRSIVEVDEIRIFNHLLPHQERCRLVEKLVQLWEGAIEVQSGKSIISILSVADMKEVFCDDLGHFTVDKYGRKIYSKENDDEYYQLNEQNKLVPVKDDEQHVYFYDECGRYFLNESIQRMYKAHQCASEYLLYRAGIMLKIREEEDGVEFLYDDLGRYFVNVRGERIYREKGSTDEYQPDGLGNLVKIRDEEEYPIYETCPVEPMVTEESFYLKRTIGTALKKCLAEVVVVQPPDPIKYLADRLEKYRHSIEARQIRRKEEEQIIMERERLAKEQNNKLPYFSNIDAEESIDLNFTEYQSQF